MSQRSSLWILSIGLGLFYLTILVLFGYGGLVFFVFLLTVLGSGALIIVRFAISRSEEVVLRGVGLSYSLEVARHALAVAEDNAFGFPSGKFEIVGLSEDGVLTARERVPQGSDRIAMSMLKMPWNLAGRVVWSIYSVFTDPSRATFAGSMIAWAAHIGIAFGFIYLMFFPVMMALVVELLLKAFVGSVITARAVESGNDVTLTFTFRGTSALLAKRRLLSSFDAPSLPERFITPTMQQATAGPAAPSGSGVPA